MSLNKRPWKIVSGGQTGVDRAGLVAAMSFSISFGGWEPKGRLAEDGVVPEGFYAMKECPAGGYRERTRANVMDSDATLVLVDQLPLFGGSEYTARFAAGAGKPCKVFNLADGDAAVQIRDWMLSLEGTVPGKETDPVTLNVAGPRESRAPGIFDKAKQTLLKVFVDFRNWSGGDICSIDGNGELCGWIDAEFLEEVNTHDGPLSN